MSRASQSSISLGLMLSALLFLPVGAACGSTSDTVPSCDGVPIDPAKELLIVAPEVVEGPLGRDVDDGVASFRHVAETLDPGEGGERLSASLVDAYESLAPGRRAAFEAAIVCPWLRRTPSNGCDESCGACIGRALDPRTSPFRLIAIASRTDLGTAPDAVSAGGEGRLVFAATTGPADDPGATELPLTVIVELALDGDRASWTRELHALSAFEDTGAAYQGALDALVRRWVHLAQIRIDDVAFGPQLFLELTAPDGRASPRGLRNTPAADADEVRLAALVLAQADAVRADAFVLEPTLRAPWLEGPHAWALPGVDETTSAAFLAHTCNGCHGGSQPSLGGFHVAPGKRGTARLSAFLTGADGELRRRAVLVQSTLCGK